MKKILVLVSSMTFIIAIIFNITLAVKNNTISTTSLSLQSLADNNCPYTEGYTQGSRNHNGKTITCCVSSSWMNGCNFSVEDSDCDKIKR
jgi:hypothetical protein